MPSEGRPRRVVIVGGGFGGLAAAKALGRANVEVTLVDRTNHHLFQPLLYQVAAGGISEGDCASPIRGHLKRQRNARVLMATVTGIDVEGREVALDSGERLPYDNLITACGAETSYFGNEEWSEASFGLKTLRDATRLRDRVFSAFERAERTIDPSERRRQLTFAVVGGGPTGVEVSGQLAIVARKIAHAFSRADTASARVILVDAGERVVPAFSERLSAKAAKGLAALGVTVREGAMATAIDRGGLTVKLGDREERIEARTVIWAAGVKAAGLTELLAQAAGVETDRGGRIVVNPDCTVSGHPEIAAIGDMARHEGRDGKPLPGLATAAIQQGYHVAAAIREGGSRAGTPFRYRDKGALAVVGRGRAVCEVGRLRFSGRPAFAMYLGVHLYYLSGVAGRRARVLDAWSAARFGTSESWVIEGELARPDPPARQEETAAGGGP